jgi:hypothetical protein
MPALAGSPDNFQQLKQVIDPEIHPIPRLNVGFRVRANPEPDT